MIKVKIIGGLGNQMFQYATAYSLSKRLGADLSIDICDAINYDIHPFRLNEYFCVGSFDCRNKPLEKMLIRTKLASILPNYYIEKSLLFDPELYSSPKKNLNLFGYFQSPRYFEKDKACLSKIFQPRKPLSDYQVNMKRKIETTNAICLHVRRGDYISNKNANKVHGTCDLSYFYRAFDVLSSENKLSSDTELFVFSDDIEWCEKSIDFPYKTNFIQDDKERPEIDMHLMSFCNHHIISNSTFSWWGAWLCTQVDQVVIAPKVWFRDGRDIDIYPIDWHKI